MHYDFDTVIERRNTCSLKWDSTIRNYKDEDILPMWVADMDFQIPPEVSQAIENRNRHGIYGYMDGNPESYGEAVADWVYKRHGWKIRNDWLVCTPGVVPALGFAIMAFTNVGDKVLIQTPVYTPFFKVVKNNGRQLVENQLVLKDGRYEIDFQDLEEKFKSGVKMMIFCSPHNPVGRVWTQDELKELGNLCIKYNVLIISDDIHSDIIYKGNKHIPISTVSPELLQNTITCIAASKTFNLAGLSTSTVIMPKEDLRAQYKNFMSNLGLHSCNILGMVAAEAAYRYGEEWLDQLINYLEGNLACLMNYFSENISKIKVIQPEGTFLVWLDCRELGMSDDELARFFLHTAKVRLNEGRSYGSGGEQFMRINIGCPRSILMEGLKRIGDSLKQIK